MNETQVNVPDDIQDLIRIRDGRPDDRAYVIKTWLSTYNNSPLARALGSAYYRAYAPVVEDSFARSRLRIACLKDEPGAIVGFAVVEADAKTIHYVCVRQQWRKRGVAKLLISDELRCDDMRYSHTAPAEIKLPKGWQYEPTLTRRAHMAGRHPDHG